MDSSAWAALTQLWPDLEDVQQQVSCRACKAALLHLPAEQGIVRGLRNLCALCKHFL